MGDWFHKFSAAVARWMGTPWAFVVALAVIVIWAVLGPVFRYSDTWQLVINTSTTIVTFLMVFLIQNTQNRDSRATQLKLDELIRATAGARNHLINLEELSDEELNELHKQFCELKGHFEQRLQRIEAHRDQRGHSARTRRARKKKS
jgi:low affinity Fe/Cu permease